MILVDLEIEDYKQFRGVRRFSPAPDGIVAIIGANGAGKTTLFEALEWCLYQPREIPLAEVQTRGQASRPRVTVTLERPDTGERWVVERRLRSGSVQASVFREDQPERIEAEGPRAVREFVAGKLIGLSHRAFVSTFFTRQKELSFFGEMGAAERRREVGRLLGLETIERARQKLQDDRTAAHNQSEAFRLFYEQQSQGRDFEAELAAVDVRLAEQERALLEATTVAETASATLDAARQRLQVLLDRQREDDAIAASIAQIEATRQTAAVRLQTAIDALKHLDEEALRLTTLEPIAAAAGERDRVLAEQDAERERHQQRERLKAELNRTFRVERDIERQLAEAVAGADDDSVPGWRWNAGAEDLLSGIDRLGKIATSVDVEAAAERVAVLERAANLQAEVIKVEAKLTKFRTVMQDLAAERERLLASGNPEIEIAAAQSARDALSAARERAATEQRTRRQTCDELTQIVTRLAKPLSDDRCPTCGRPFSAADLELTKSTLEERITKLNRELAQFVAAEKQAIAELQLADKRQVTAAAAQAEIVKLSGRLQSGETHLASAGQEHSEAANLLSEFLAEHSMVEPPSAGELQTAQKERDRLTRIAHTAPVLRSLRKALDTCLSERLEAERELGLLGPDRYDPEVHERARAAVHEARNAIATIAEITRDLTQRPEWERKRDQETAAVARAGEELERASERRREFGFDPALLPPAKAEEAAALRAEQVARDARGAAAATLAGVGRDRDALQADQAQIASYDREATEMLRHEELLTKMVTEFVEFEKFVAREITPALADHTSELVAAVTDGKYDRVEFDESYGLKVFDGPYESFPLAQSSGGEQDVVALCARLALSRLVGGRANNPPGFLVLDEVFGSLDRDRRQAVLETLGTLTGTADAFHQLFVISHVDDVRQSPIFSEVWRVAEGANGFSDLENLNLTGGSEDV